MSQKPQDKWKKSFSGIHNQRSHHDKFWEKVEKKDDDSCWIWLGHIDKYGYGKFWNYLSHRFAWIDAYGDIPNGMYVCHRCDNPSCVNPKHLFLGTQFDNMRDMVSKGRIHDHHGQNNPKAKLTESDVREIYRLHNGGMSGYKIAKMFSVTQTAIRSVIIGKTWKHIYEQATHV